MCVETRQLITRFAGVTADKYIETASSFADAVNISLQVSRTLQRINQRGFTHNDVKENNVCVSTQNGSPVATVIDVGLARRVGTQGIFGRTYDTEQYPWIAPELLRNTHPCSEASDAFGLAYLVYKLGLEEGRIYCPSMPALVSWVQDARRPHPGARPTLAALIEVLEALHKEVTTTQPSAYCTIF